MRKPGQKRKQSPHRLSKDEETGVRYDPEVLEKAPGGWFRRIEDGRRVCGARRIRSHIACEQDRIDQSNGRCRMHGGTSLRGWDHPGAKHLGYSKAVQGSRLAEHFTEALSDPELLNIRHEVALARGFTAEALTALAAGQPAEDTWRRMKALREQARAAMVAGKRDELASIVNQLFVLIDSGADYVKGRREVLALATKKAQLAEAERRRMVEMGATLTIEQQTAVQMYLVNLVRSEVQDRSVVQRIADKLEEFARRMDGRSMGEVPTTTHLIGEAE